MTPRECADHAASPPSLPTLLLVGDLHHGVARHAADVAAAVQRLAPAVRIVRGVSPVDQGALHVHFTDRLWGQTPALAAARLRSLAAGRRLTVTLHDVPQPSDGPASLAHRRAAYRAVITASAGVVVSSEHERMLLVETGTLDAGVAGRVQVIPLPVDPVALHGPGERGPSQTTPEPDDDAVALLGFFYPGKGHAEAIDAVACLPAPRPSVRVLGASAHGHETELAGLCAAARARGIDFAATGWLDAPELITRARRAAIPLAAHVHLSASGSINAWIAAGRVPLVVDSRYAREMARLRPGSIRLYPPAGLPAAILSARARPGSSRAPAGLDTRPHLPEVAARYLRLWAAG